MKRFSQNRTIFVRVTAGLLALFLLATVFSVLLVR